MDCGQITKSPLRIKLDAVQNSVRATFFGFTSLLVLLGAGVTEPNPALLQITVLIIVAINFHCFGYVHNDIVDLPIDLTAPLRAEDPLVRGSISAATASKFAWSNLLMSFVVTYAAGASWKAHAILVVGYIATILYNTYGKRCPVPFVTDAVQGIAWISIALYGSQFVGNINSLSVVIAGFGFGFIFLINGVHGGLRDLTNDLNHERMTTAIYFGATSIDEIRVRSSTTLQLFAMHVFALITVPSGYVLLSNQLEYGEPVLNRVLVSWGIVSAISAWLFWEVVRIEHDTRKKAIYGSAFFLLLGPLVVFVPSLGELLQTTVLVSFFLPMLIFQDRITFLKSLAQVRHSVESR